MIPIFIRDAFLSGMILIFICIQVASANGCLVEHLIHAVTTNPDWDDPHFHLASMCDEAPDRRIEASPARGKRRCVDTED